MRYVVRLEGQQYSKNKETFKELLKKHGLKWRGTFDKPWWGSTQEKVEAHFERDPIRDVTTTATLEWTGRRETPFLEEFQAWALGSGGHVEKGDERRPIPQGQQELEFWDYVHKPDEEALRRQGRPERWIQLDLEEWKRRRREKEKELRAD